MKIAIVRGAGLTQTEMQTYEPIAKEHKVTAYYSNDSYTNINEINLPKKELTSIEGILTRPISKVLNYPMRVLGYRQHMIGLETELRDYDIANVVETYHAYCYQAIKAQKQYGTKVVVTCFETIPFFCEDRLIFRLNMRSKIKKEVRDNADLFIAITNAAKEALIYEGVSEDRIKVIPLSVDTWKFQPRLHKKSYFKQKYGLNDNDFVVLFVGRLLWEKGVYDLIYAAKRLLLDGELKNISLKFVLVGGESNEVTQIKQLIAQLELKEHVKLLGMLPYNEIPFIYNIADVFVAPSIPTRGWNEQFGVVFPEALASGLPIITTYTGAIPDVIGEAGVLVQPNEPYALYKELKRLVLKDEVRRMYSALALDRAEKVFSPEVVANKLIEVYREVIENG